MHVRDLHISLRFHSVTVPQATSHIVSGTDGVFDNEYSYIWHISPDADGVYKITRFTEFVDSEGALAFGVKEAARRAALYD